MVYADDLVVGTGGEVAAIRRKSDRVDGAKMVAHVAELSWFRVGFVVRVVYGIGGPNANVAIWQVKSARVF